MAAESLPTTIVPATPAPSTPSVYGAADIRLAVLDADISYGIAGCPVAAWLDETMEDGVNFGTYPEYVTADDGTRWSTHMVVLQIFGRSVTDWSFVLTSPLSGIPGDPEHSLISRPDRDNRIELAITSTEATFTTGFWDSQSSDNNPLPVPGTVSVTCR